MDDVPSDILKAVAEGGNFIGFTGGVSQPRERLLDAGDESETAVGEWADLGDLSLLL